LPISFYASDEISGLNSRTGGGQIASNLRMVTLPIAPASCNAIGGGRPN